ncbi:hypothetical protein T440DRAFT_389859 [Plenodomus tracheiphilus IPT5]|uniref:Geranylgeranyl pyrophosphate synthetase n=1 Tax=Plenodomus tracheiphilus IPT5 TaxID=1408161 RepID=A0A6A7BDG0_9PLEO|nr:hypothetical protein T440DRAFT_389859 [Plenodomus tracheiphilus IPT5]
MLSSPSSSRGGFAPRRGRGGWNRPSAKKWEPVKLDTDAHPLGELLQTVQGSDLKLVNASTDVSIDDCRYVASYNWLSDATTATIIAGRPPRWTPLQTPQRLKEDSGQYFRDPNAARCPEYPMAPVVKAILQQNPALDAGSIDLVACGSTLGNLLRFVRGIDKPFRFNVQVIGDTVFFIRKENDPKELIKDVRGFGHTFPDAYTTWDNDVKNSETHQRIVQYVFAGLKCFVRFEVDGYLKDRTAGGGSGDKVNLRSPTGPFSANDLSQAFGNATIGTASAIAKASNGSFNTTLRGSEIPQGSIFDLKTRSGKYKKDIDMSDMYPLLWIKQIPNFIVAYHDGAGLFQDIRVQDVRADVQRWEKENIDCIRRLSSLLNIIIDIARKDDKVLLEVISQKVNVLQIRRQHGQGMQALPVALQNEWLATSGGVSVEDDDLSSDTNAGHDAVYDSEEDWKFGSDDEEPDYTACSAEDCGYCGKCTY